MALNPMKNADAPDAGARKPALSVAFILRPYFTLFAFSAIVDTLRLAADEGDRSRPINCRWTILGSSLAPVQASCGVEVQPWETFGDPSRFDYIVVVGGLLHRAPRSDDAVMDFLKRAAKQNVALVGVCTGAFTLLRAGLMNGRRACVSWFHYRDLIEEFPEVTPVADQIFVVDGNRITCAGGAGAVDLAAWMVRRHLGRVHAQKALHIMVVDAPRPPNTPQPQPPIARAVSNDRVRRAMLLIEQHISEPLSIEEIAAKVNISKRQLERVFREEVGTPIQVFSRNLRLHYGLWLLAHTRRTITDIAQECGFTDISHFNRTFRHAFNCTARELRNRGPEAVLETLQKFSLTAMAGYTPPLPVTPELRGDPVSAVGPEETDADGDGDYGAKAEPTDHEEGKDDWDREAAPDRVPQSRRPYW